MSEKFICPRRAAERGTDTAEDTWEDRAGNGVRQCSYDGSVHPDEFMDYVRKGGEVGSTDKGYKFYLDDLRKIGMVTGAGKFYTHHLSEEQAEEFFRLWRAGTINFGMYPPYVLLYLPGMTQEKAQQIRDELSAPEKDES